MLAFFDLLNSNNDDGEIIHVGGVEVPVNNCNIRNNDSISSDNNDDVVTGVGGMEVPPARSIQITIFCWPQSFFC